MKASKLLVVGLTGMLMFGIQNTAAFAQSETEAKIETTQEMSMSTLMDQKNAQLEKSKAERYSASNTENISEKQNTPSARSVSNTSNVSPTSSSYSEEELKLLACAVYAESGNQSYSGQLAVANVILNRVNSKRYSNTISGVLHEPNQFGIVRNGSLTRTLNSYDSSKSGRLKTSISAAKAALEGQNSMSGYYFFTRYSSSLANQYKNGVKIGDHYFY